MEKNLLGGVLIQNSKVEDTISSKGLVHLNSANIIFDNTQFLGNFALRNTNGIQMIRSELTMLGGKIDNTRNVHSFPLKFKSSIDYGFIMMNFECLTTITDATIVGLSGVSSSFAYFTGRSQLFIYNTHFIGCISPTSLIQGMVYSNFELRNSILRESSTIFLSENTESVTIIEDTEFHANGQSLIFIYDINA